MPPCCRATPSADARARRQADACILDEAAQLPEAQLAIVLDRCPSLALMVMVGDPRQLPATVMSRAACELGYARSGFERLQAAGRAAALLDTQYRMHPAISAWPRAQFYGGKVCVEGGGYGGFRVVVVCGGVVCVHMGWRRARDGTAEDRLGGQGATANARLRRPCVRHAHGAAPSTAIHAPAALVLPPPRGAQWAAARAGSQQRACHARGSPGTQAGSTLPPPCFPTTGKANCSGICCGCNASDAGSACTTLPFLAQVVDGPNVQGGEHGALSTAFGLPCGPYTVLDVGSGREARAEAEEAPLGAQAGGAPKGAWGEAGRGGGAAAGLQGCVGVAASVVGCVWGCELWCVW